jgi:hypothetical protein
MYSEMLPNILKYSLQFNLVNMKHTGIVTCAVSVSVLTERWEVVDRGGNQIKIPYLAHLPAPQKQHILIRLLSSRCFNWNKAYSFMNAIYYCM